MAASAMNAPETASAAMDSTASTFNTTPSRMPERVRRHNTTPATINDNPSAAAWARNQSLNAVRNR